jgi:hypothetical protein
MKGRLNMYVSPEIAAQVATLAAKQRLKKSEIVEAALASFFSPDAADRREAAFTRRLDRLTRQFEQLQRDQTIAIEALALFVRYSLSITPALPEAQQAAARAQGKERYETFIQSLGRRLQQGKSLARDLHEEVCPSAADFGVGDAAAAEGGDGAR